MATTTSLELERYPEAPRLDEQQPGNNQIQDSINQPQLQNIQGLEPADGGSSAWKLLLGAFSFEAILWGKTYENPST
jgi:hypothetical protein